MELTDEKRKIAEAIEYYRSIDARWCWIQKRYNRSRAELERLIALYREEQKNAQTKT